MKSFVLGLILLQICHEVATDLFNKDEYLEVLNPFVVSHVYKRHCCLEHKTLQYMPVRSDNIQDFYKIISWKHTSQTDEKKQPYILDCYASKQQDTQQYIARVFCNPEVILLELEVSNCDEIREIVKIDHIFFNHGNRLYYHKISVKNVKFPRKNPSKLLDHTIENNSNSVERSKRRKPNKKDYLKCVHFEVHENRDEEKDCNGNIVFDPNDWTYDDTDGNKARNSNASSSNRASFNGYPLGDSGAGLTGGYRRPPSKTPSVLPRKSFA